MDKRPANMTIREWATKYLVDNGMADQVAATIVSELKVTGMESRWNDPVAGYPETMFPVLQLALDRSAVEWIDNNLPLAWYRPMFTRG